MRSIVTGFRRFVYRVRTTYLRPQNILLGGALVLCAVWVVSAVATMTKNWQQQRELEAARLEAARLELEIDMAKLNQEYYRSAEYKELVARAVLGKAMEGETLVLLPKNSARAIDKYAPVDAPAPAPMNNFDEWLKFLFD